MDIGRSGHSFGNFTIKKMGNDYNELFSFSVDFLFENALFKIR
jgi:hypothetical protein